MIEEAIIGGVAGVAVPIAIEEFTKGKRIEALKNVKMSGITGLGAGIMAIGAVALDEYGYVPLGLTDEWKIGLASFGGASLATSAIILYKDYIAQKKGTGVYVKNFRKGLEQRIPEEVETVIIS